MRALGPARYAVGEAAGLGVWALSRRRRLAAANHRRLDPGIDEREARRRARRSYREYGRTVVDFLWGIDLDAATVTRCTHLHGLEDLLAVRDAGRGAIIVLGHFGSWDMCANVAAVHGIPLSTVMSPVGPPAITDLVIWARESNQLEVFTPERAARGLVRALRRGRFVCLLCDIPGGGPTVVVDYCGGPVAFTTAPAVLARVTGAPIFPIDSHRSRDGYEIVVQPPVVVEPGEDDTTVMQRVAVSLERVVRRHPEQWYPFGQVYADER
ncbi:MAG TPA: lysophospholipid acyltransferase family protein [Candidatus Dormibacteraeota bacterium]|nr:lysophospholipid acyltransferase family protein [Candidatus Dormibacteraeota bacterium]